MDKEIITWLYDINSAINEIEDFFEKDQKVFDIYTNDLKTKRAVERNLEIIGEAIKRIIEKDSTISLSNARKIVDTRNRIIHGYGSVSDDIIWGIIINHLPKLKSEVESFMDI